MSTDLHNGFRLGANPSVPTAQYTASAFTLNLGLLDDISGFSVGVDILPANVVSGLHFETNFNLGSDSYLLRLAGKSAQVTPSGNTTDFQLQASLVPAPGAAVSAPGSLPLALGAFGAMAWVGKRRRRDS